MKGRVALVTGGGRGIGREAALLLSAAGARVVIVSRTTEELAGVLAGLKPGQRVSVRIVQPDGSRREVQVTLGQLPGNSS